MNSANTYYLYILASRHHRHLSVGVTSDLVTGVQQHRLRTNRRLRKRRVWQKLVYVEVLNGLETAVSREVDLNKISRLKLNRLVESVNPGWDSMSLKDIV